MPRPLCLPHDQISFIRAWYLDDVEICDQLIDHFNHSPLRRPGVIRTLHDHNPVVDRSVKHSTEIEFSLDDAEPIYMRYLTALQQVVDRYMAELPLVNAQAAWRIIEPSNLQYYPPGGGYKNWHCERSSHKLPTASRHMVFMTYLNDVTDQGETEFFHQNIKIRPEKALTVIWPADWTHTHRGVISPSQDKYIITGWFNFVE